MLFFIPVYLCYKICLTKCGMFGVVMFGICDVQDVECSGCGVFGMWDVRGVGCSGSGMFGIWDAQVVRCSGCVMWNVGYEMWDVCWDVGC